MRAQQVRSLYIKNFRELFSRYDVLISSPTPGYALPLGASLENPMFGELQDILVEPSSLAGLPGISIPMYRDDITNLYLGLNIIADHWQEEKVFRAAYAFESHTDWNPWITDLKNI
jgi:aspartyl-tRNA(Asn)/glutamyl-tRNA(Gln) amidotransferase subunit A